MLPDLNPTSLPSAATPEMVVTLVLHGGPCTAWLHQVDDDTGLPLSDAHSCALDWFKWRAVVSAARPHDSHRLTD